MCILDVLGRQVKCGMQLSHAARRDWRQCLHTVSDCVMNGTSSVNVPVQRLDVHVDSAIHALGSHAISGVFVGKVAVEASVHHNCADGKGHQTPLERCRPLPSGA